MAIALSPLNAMNAITDVDKFISVYNIVDATPGAPLFPIAYSLLTQQSGYPLRYQWLILEALSYSSMKYLPPSHLFIMALRRTLRTRLKISIVTPVFRLRRKI